MLPDILTDSNVVVEPCPVNTSGSSVWKELERVALDYELVNRTWSPIHLRSKLKELYWKADKVAVKEADFWVDTLRVLAQAIVKGAATRDFFGTAYGQSGDTFVLSSVIPTCNSMTRSC